MAQSTGCIATCPGGQPRRSLPSRNPTVRRRPGRCVYSTLSSLIINIIIKYFSLTEDDVNEAKEEKRKDPKNFLPKAKKIVKKIKIKFVIFFILVPIFILFLGFYLCCFCGVYKNSQIHLIKDSLISFAISITSPFLTLLLPGIFRILALRSEKKDKTMLYKISKIFEMF